MKKYQLLVKKKQRLEEKIEKLCDKFTDSTGLIVRNAGMNIDVKTLETLDLKTKVLANYKVEINCEV